MRSKKSPRSRRLTQQSRMTGSLNSHGHIRGHRTNEVILLSIPLNRKMKRYWVGKYLRMCSANGREWTNSKFTDLRTCVMAYISDPNRHNRPDVYAKRAGFRNNGYLRMLFEYADTQPHFVLAFLKLYTGESSRKPSRSQSLKASEKLYHELESDVRSDPKVPRYLQAWADFVMRPRAHAQRELRREYQFYREHRNSIFHRLAAAHTCEQWLEYWNKWFRVFQKGWTSPISEKIKPAFPEVYSDYGVDPEKPLSSPSNERDLADLAVNEVLLKGGYQGDIPPALSRDSLRYVESYLDSDLRNYLSTIRTNRHGNLRSHEGSATDIGSIVMNRAADALIFSAAQEFSGLRIGHISHIPKKGTGSDLRDIAVPNRFIQQALGPFAKRLYKLLYTLPKDATFDQNKFDSVIAQRVTNPSLYQGSVDLHHASNFLPANWGFWLCDVWLDRWLGAHSIGGCNLLKAIGLMDSTSKDMDLVRSYVLSKEVACGYWDDNGKLVRFGHRDGTRIRGGQPLGTWHSFALLGVTHNLFLESLAAYLGYTHSPYWVLGDDVVIANKRLRNSYIREFRSRAIPLSLHKSYTGRLSEFAGKIYIEKNLPFYSTDHAPINWSNLFDWQRATGIRIPYRYLPDAVKHKMATVVATTLLPSWLGGYSLRDTPASAQTVGWCESCLRSLPIRVYCKGPNGYRPTPIIYGYPSAPVGKKFTFFTRRTHSSFDASRALSMLHISMADIENTYLLAQECLVLGKGSHIYPVTDNEILLNSMTSFFSEMEMKSEVANPTGDLRSSVVPFDGHPLQLMDQAYARKDGHFLRYQRVQVPTWYRDKFRPDATSTIIEVAARSLTRRISS